MPVLERSSDPTEPTGGTGGDRPARTVTVSRPATVLVVVFGVALVGLLTLQLLDIERQRRVAARQEGRVKEALSLIAPEVDRARRALPAVTQGVKRVARGAKRADGLVRGLRGQDAPGAIAAAGALAKGLNRAGAADALAATGQLARGLDRVDAAAALASTGALAQQLTQGGRAVGAIDRLTGLLNRLRAADTVGDIDATRAIAADILRLTRRVYSTSHHTLSANVQSLDVQRQTLELLRESVAIQREVLQHTRSLDRKLGGEQPSR